MSACEKCWTDAYKREVNNPMKSQAEHYRDILEERKNNPCSIAEQTGLDKYLADYVQQEIENVECSADDMIDHKLEKTISKGIEAFQSTKNVKIRIEK